MSAAAEAGRRRFLAGLGVLAASSFGGRALAAGLGDSARGEAPFQLLLGSAILIEAVIDRRAVSVLLDTGAAETLVSPQLASTLGWPLGAGQTLRGNGGLAQAAQGRPLTLGIGDYPLTTPTSVILDLDLISSSIGRPIDVVLGRHLFDATVVALDFQNRRIGMGADLWNERRDGETLMLSTGAHGERLLPVSLEGRPTVQAVFDLGNSSPLMLSADYAARAGLLRGKRTSTAAIGGVDGVQVATTVMIDRLAVAGVVVRDLPTDVLPKWLSPDIPANLGLPTLSRFHVICDFAHDRVHLATSPERLAPAFDEDHCGLGVAVRADRLDIVHVSTHSPAAAAGFKAGDQIIAIGDRWIDQSYLTGDLWRWRTGPPGRVIAVTLSNGSVRRIKLEDYY